MKQQTSANSILLYLIQRGKDLILSSSIITICIGIYNI